MSPKRFLVTPLVLAIACKPPTPAGQMDAVLSWISTAGLAGDAWLRHTTPDKYTRQTLELSGKTLVQIGNELLKSPPAAIDSAVLASALTQSRFHIAQLARLVEEKNSPDFKIQLDSLRIARKVVKNLAAELESSQ
jgi:hypothetical protein